MASSRDMYYKLGRDLVETQLWLQRNGLVRLFVRPFLGQAGLFAALEDQLRRCSNPTRNSDQVRVVRNFSGSLEAVLASAADEYRANITVRFVDREQLFSPSVPADRQFRILAIPIDKHPATNFDDLVFDSLASAPGVACDANDDPSLFGKSKARMDSTIQSLDNLFSEHCGKASQRAVASKWANSWKPALISLRNELSTQPDAEVKFIGSTGVGKTTLINRLLGITLPTSALDVCTNARTEVAFKDIDQFEARISFIGGHEWTQDRVYYTQTCSSRRRRSNNDEENDENSNNIDNDDDDDDDDEVDVGPTRSKNHDIPPHKVLRCRIHAIYTKEEIKTLRIGGDFSEPSEIVAHLGREITLSDSDFEQLTFKLDDFTHPSEGRKLWPLIKCIQIFGRFPLLHGGVTLVDLPGFNDPNPARMAITYRALERHGPILLCTAPPRPDTADFSKNLGLLLQNGQLSNTTVVITKLDYDRSDITGSYRKIRISGFEDANWDAIFEFDLVKTTHTAIRDAQQRAPFEDVTIVPSRKRESSEIESSGIPGLRRMILHVAQRRREAINRIDKSFTCVLESITKELQETGSDVEIFDQDGFSETLHRHRTTLEAFLQQQFVTQIEAIRDIHVVAPIDRYIQSKSAHDIDRVILGLPGSSWSQLNAIMSRYGVYSNHNGSWNVSLDLASSAASQIAYDWNIASSIDVSALLGPFVEAVESIFESLPRFPSDPFKIRMRATISQISSNFTQQHNLTQIIETYIRNSLRDSFNRAGSISKKGACQKMKEEVAKSAREAVPGLKGHLVSNFQNRINTAKELLQQLIDALLQSIQASSSLDPIKVDEEFIDQVRMIIEKKFDFHEPEMVNSGNLVRTAESVDSEGISDHLRDPIMLGLIRDPVKLSDNRYYDRMSISLWMENNQFSPFTRQRIEYMHEAPECLEEIRQWLQNTPAGADYLTKYPSYRDLLQ